jgi:outer membrane immunogenic protein
VSSGGTVKKHLAGIAALLMAAGSGAAFAADLPPAPQAYAPPPVLASPIYSWTGCYLGIEGGGAWGQSQHTAVESTPTAPAGFAPIPTNNGRSITGNFNVSGGLFGGTAGCNYQLGHAVIGIEDDMSWTNISGTTNDIAPFNLAARSSTNETWLDTLRGRVGVSWDRFFFYGTGGVAFANEGVNVCPPAGCFSDSQIRTGWTAGVGGEWAAWTVPAGTLTFKVEYLHVDLGTGRFIDPAITLPGGGTVLTRDVRLTDEIFRGGINWKFNGW